MVEGNILNQDKLFTESSLAKYLECTAAALRRMRREKRGPRWVRVGRLVRYPRRWVEEWLQANEGGGQQGEGTR